MAKCDLCKTYGLEFNRKYDPADFIEGKRSSKIWIVGLNPKADIHKVDNRTVEDLVNFFQDRPSEPYFKDFRSVSELIFSKLGDEYGVSHTDIVKCFSNKFPHKNLKKAELQAIINNCSTYLIDQIKQYKPEMIICNGVATCRIIQTIIPPEHAKDTYYIGCLDGQQIIVILSGFIGRIDNYSKRRLGMEIEKLLDPRMFGQ